MNAFGCFQYVSRLISISSSQTLNSDSMPMTGIASQVRWGSRLFPISSFQSRRGMRVIRGEGGTAPPLKANGRPGCSGGRSGLRRLPPLPPAPFLERETGAVFLRHLHPVLADLTRDDGNVADVDVNVIVGSLSRDVAVREHANVVGELLGEVVVLLDRFLRLEDVRADAVDVGGGSPHVRRRAEGELVRRRAVAAVDRDVHRGAGGGAELLEVEGQHPHRAWDVARERLQPRRLLEIDEDELVHAEVRREGDAHGLVVRGDLVEIAREAMAAPVLVTHHLAGTQQRPQLVVEVESVDDFQPLMLIVHTSCARGY